MELLHKPLCEVTVLQFIWATGVTVFLLYLGLSFGWMLTQSLLTLFEQKVLGHSKDDSCRGASQEQEV